MVAKKGTKAATKKFEFKGFVNLEFTSDEKQALGDWLNTFNDSVEDSITVLAEAEYKVGISYDEIHSAFSLAITCKYKSSPYYGYCFVLKHSDVSRGVNILRRVYDTLLAEGLYKLEEPEGKYDW